MVKWVQLHLSQGAFEGKQLINKNTLKAMHVVQTPLDYPIFNVPEESPYLFGYGLGWMTGLYKGHYMVMHSGSIDGFVSNVMFLPKENIGIVMLTNSQNHFLFTSSAAFCIADFLMGIEDQSWIEQIAENEKIVNAALTKQNIESPAGDNSSTARPTHEYVGEFENPGYGPIQVFLRDNELIASYNDISYVLAYKCFDHFISTLQISFFEAKFGCFFTRNSSGDVSEFHMSLEPSLPAIPFKRKAENALLAEEYLRQFTGEFESNDFFVEIVLKKGKLSACIPGQPIWEFTPEKPFLFSIQALPGVTVRFVPDEEGKISEAVFIQPNGSFSFKAK
jgi:hypothetical protein